MFGGEGVGNIDAELSFKKCDCFKHLGSIMTDVVTCDIFRQQSLWETWQREHCTELCKKNISKEIKNIIIHNILENIPAYGDEMWSLTENFRSNTKGSCIRGRLQVTTEKIKECNVMGRNGF
jgi:hypothetical protein